MQPVARDDWALERLPLELLPFQRVPFENVPTAAVPGRVLSRVPSRVPTPARELDAQPRRHLGEQEIRSRSPAAVAKRGRLEIASRGAVGRAGAQHELGGAPRLAPRLVRAHLIVLVGVRMQLARRREGRDGLSRTVDE